MQAPCQTPLRASAVDHARACLLPAAPPQFSDFHIANFVSYVFSDHVINDVDTHLEREAKQDEEEEGDGEAGSDAEYDADNDCDDARAGSGGGDDERSDGDDDDDASD